MSHSWGEAYWLKHLSPYSVDGDYLCYSKLSWVGEGVPFANCDGQSCYNPVTVAQYALSHHGLGNTDVFMDSARLLLTLQDNDGAFRYPFSYSHYLCPSQPFQKGWVSGMAQGQALSVFARAYLLSGDSAFLQGGDLALECLQRPVAQGGCKTSMACLDGALSSLIFFEEYPTRPESYTLNGFLFTVIGLYDWKCVKSMCCSGVGGIEALFYECVKTIEAVLPFFDISGFSVYDLGYITFNARKKYSFRYHACHVMQLHALNGVVDSDVMRNYENSWGKVLRNRSVVGFIYSVLRKKKRALQAK